MSELGDYTYVGSELDLASDAVNWKRYWAAKTKPYLGKRVLEVGAGIGANIGHLSGLEQKHWLALEPDPKLARIIEARKADGSLPSHCDVRIGTLADLGADEKFDTILYIDVLEHIENDKAEVDSAAAHLNPGGFLVVLAPAHQALFSELDTALGHYRRYNRGTLIGLKPEGLVLERCLYLDSLGALASLANRLVLKSDIPSTAQLKVWDRVLVRTSRLVDAVLRYQVGKSILAAWQKT